MAVPVGHPAVKHGLGRLKRRPEFLRVAGKGRKWAAPGLVLQAASTKQAGTAHLANAAIRVGFTASRKVGNAVARNRARRRLREAARHVLPDQARPGFDFVIIARRTALTRPFPALIADLELALRRVGAHVREPDERT